MLHHKHYSFTNRTVNPNTRRPSAGSLSLSISVLVNTNRIVPVADMAMVRQHRLRFAALLAPSREPLCNFCIDMTLRALRGGTSKHRQISESDTRSGLLSTKALLTVLRSHLCCSSGRLQAIQSIHCDFIPANRCMDVDSTSQSMAFFINWRMNT